MKTNIRNSIGGLALLSALVVLPQPSTCRAQGTAFTYQGRLESGGSPYTGNAEFQPTLWDAASGGSQVAANSPAQVFVGVTNGLFTLTLDFGGAAFDGSPRWLQLEVRTNIGPFTLLAPRQALTATPYAIRAANAGAATTATTASGVSANAVGTAGLQDNSVTSAKIADGTIAAADVNAATFNSTFWRAVGNAGTAPGTHFLGTTDTQPLEVRVNNQRALRLEPTGSNSVNVIGGYAGNFVGLGVVGATIGGGGAGDYFGLAYTNRVLAIFGTVGGGAQNTASGLSATVGGGLQNTASGWSATVGGGYQNTASGSYATVGGGYQNTASGNFATVPGGVLNSATNYAFAAGYRAKANHPGAFVWADSTAADIASTNANSMTFRASGGVRFFSNSGASAGVFLAPGGTSWATISDRNAKKNFRSVDTVAVLEKLAALPVQRWHYRWEADDAVPHLGPVAQDFKAAFYPGRDETSLTTQEVDGVALAAIQGLNQKLEARSQEFGARSRELEAKSEELAARSQRLEAENAALRARLEKLEQLLAAQLNGGGQ
jgi:hypothetical protein